MKYLLSLLLCLCLVGRNAWGAADSDAEDEFLYRTCIRPAIVVRDEYWKSVQYKQFGRNNLDWDALSEKEKSEYKTRNICIGDFMDVHFNCEFYKCLKDQGKEDRFVVLFLSQQLTGEEICNFIQSIDCFNSDISVVKNFVSRSGGVSSELFSLNMDDIVSDIKAGKKIDFGKVDTNNEICWSADSKGDTIWHALATSVTENTFGTVANLCLSVLSEDRKGYVYDAAFFNKNKQGKTAVAVALSADNIDRYSIFGQYFKQEGVECDSLLDYAAKEANVDKTQLYVLCPAG